MTPANLILALAKEIETAVKDYKLKAENQGDRKITVYAQHIKDEDFEDGAYYPLVIVSLQKAKDHLDNSGPEASMATVGLTFGVFAEDKNGWMDLLNIMEHVRQRILTNRTIEQTYRLTDVVEWETIEAQPYPFWFGYGTLKYTIAQPQEGFPLEFQEVMEEYIK